jgi:hypothetical protein
MPGRYGALAKHTRVEVNPTGAFRADARRERPAALIRTRTCARMEDAGTPGTASRRR